VSRLVRLDAGQQVPYGGDQVATVPAELAAAFRDGDRLVVVHDTGDLLHVPAAEHGLAEAAVGRAVEAFHRLAQCSDQQITSFFVRFAELLDDPSVVAQLVEANAADVAAAEARGRAVGRLRLTESMRAAMVDGLRSWAEAPAQRDRQVGEVRHQQWTVGEWRAPLGVVAFVFEGRPNVLADACGVLRTGNTAVLRIGSDALGTARAIAAQALDPALASAGLPAGSVQLVDSPAHAAGWALFADQRVGLAVARGSGRAVGQLGAVARQHGVPASLHGTGGAWLMVDSGVDSEQLALVVANSLDRKVCNTLNVCCVLDSATADRVQQAAIAAAAARGVRAVVHHPAADDDLGHEFEWDTDPEMWLVQVESLAQAVALFNRHSPRFVASLLSDDAATHEWFYRAVDAPFVGNGFTRWVDGQFALGQPELGLSNWEPGRLFGRGGVLSGDSVFTVRLRADVHDHHLHR
jgi:glutamate-5-semialdehyde dehydrogenase